MKTYKLTSEKEILKMIEQSLKVTDAKDYCQRLAGFFKQKLEDIIEFFVICESHGKDSLDADKAEGKIHKKYGIPCVNAYDLKESFEDYHTAMNHFERLDNIVEKIVKEELKNPTSVEVEDLDDEDEIVRACLDIDSNFYNGYAEVVMPANICELYDHSYGISKWFETELSQFLQFYDLKS